MTKYDNSTTGLGKAIQYVTNSIEYGKQRSGEQKGETLGGHSQNSEQNGSNGNNSKMSEDDNANNKENNDNSDDNDQKMGNSGDNRNGSEDDESQHPPEIVCTHNYKRHKWTVRGRPNLFAKSFNPFQFLTLIEQSSLNAIWYPTNKVTFPPLSPFTDVETGFPEHAVVDKFFNIGYKNNSMFIKFDAVMRYTPLKVKHQLDNYLRKTNVFMEYQEICETTWDVSGFIWGLHDVIHWRLTYEQLLNQEIKKVLSDTVPPHISSEIQSLSNKAKNIHINLKSGPFYGNSAKIEGVLIKTKSCHYNMIQYTLSKIDSNVFSEHYQIMQKLLLKNLDKRSSFDSALTSHNVCVNQYRTIPVRFLPPGFRDMKVSGVLDGFPQQLIAVQFKKFLITTCRAISIKETNDTSTNGTYLILFLDKDYKKATQHLRCLFEAFKMNQNHEVTKAAKTKWHHLPYVDQFFSNNQLETQENELTQFFKKVSSISGSKAKNKNYQYQFDLSGIPDFALVVRRTRTRIRKRKRKRTGSRLVRTWPLQLPVDLLEHQPVPILATKTQTDCLIINIVPTTLTGDTLTLFYPQQQMPFDPQKRILLAPQILNSHWNLCRNR